MAFDEELADRMREVLSARPEVDERKMFGGLAFMVNGNMACGIVGDELMVRVGSDNYEDALAQPYAREMTFTGKAMKGMVYVAPEGFASRGDLTAWIRRGTDFAGGLPPKAKNTSSNRK